MITIEQVDDEVVLKMLGRAPVGGTDFIFKWDAKHKSFAALLAHNLNNHLRRRLARVKFQMYQLGRKDQKNKKRNRNFEDFYGDFNSIEIARPRHA